MSNPIQINLTEDQESIIALATPQGSGAIALIRISGDNAFEIVNSISHLTSNKSVTALPSHTIQHGFIVDSEHGNQLVDEVLFFLMHGPKTFTGQDVIEISCHNNQFIIEKIIQLACKNGARQAKAGEFSKRAFLSGKINLVQAEAINEIIHAQNEATLKKSMEQLAGTLSNFLMQLEQKFVALLGVVEASFEFLAEEQADIELNKLIKSKCSEISTILNELKISFNHQQQIRDGIKIALLGPVNAGKSTLFNVLIGKNRAIVSEIEGTTRDSIEASLYKGGFFWTFIDTAGLRQTNDSIEQEGISRSMLEAEKSDLILFVIDLSQKLSDDFLGFYHKILDKHADKIIVVLNKIDKIEIENLLFIHHDCVVKISAEQLVGIDELSNVIQQKVENMMKKSFSSFLLNQRQARLISEISEKLDFVESNLLNTLEYELMAYKIKEILLLMSELTGRDVGERVLDSVFSNFCVGK